MALTRRELLRATAGAAALSPLGCSGTDPGDLITTDLLEVEERNGYAMLDFDRDRIECQLFRCPAGYVSPDQLQVEVAVPFEIS